LWLILIQYVFTIKDILLIIEIATKEHAYCED